MKKQSSTLLQCESRWEEAHAILVFSQNKTSDEISYERNNDDPDVLQWHTDKCEQTISIAVNGVGIQGE